jgi:hypothetical protein
VEEDNWASPEKAKVVAKLPQTPAKGYFNPEIKSVSVELKADEDCFTPVYDKRGHSAKVFANIQDGFLPLPGGSTEKIDCGISLKFPISYKLGVVSEIPGLFLTIDNGERLVLTAFNAGDDLTLSHKQIVGSIFIEPVYLFEWKFARSR